MSGVELETTAPSLREFAANLPPTRRRCLLCTVPDDIYAQVVDAKNAGISYSVMGKWLTQVGYGGGEPVTKGRLEKHFQLDHTR